MQRPHRVDFWVGGKRLGIEAQALLGVLAEADQTHREILWCRLLNPPDVER
jgi:hypothetical protein